MTQFTIGSPGSAEQARGLLSRATPPNTSVTQTSNFAPERIERVLRLGFRRPEWVWFARAVNDDEDHGEGENGHGTILGLVAGWGSATSDAPFVLDLIDLPLDRPDVAKSILDRATQDSAVPGRATIEIVHVLPAESRLEDAEVAGFIDLLAGAEFRLLVRRHRYRLDVRREPITIPVTSLRFDSVERADDPRLVAIMAEILQGSLDAHDRDALARGDLASVAADTVAEFIERDPIDSMYLALDPDDAVVGLVIGGLRGSPDSGSASFIGVSHERRGRGYAAQLLGWITKRMIAEGALYIVGETDDDNFPMAAAFGAVGYPARESRIDFVRDIAAT